MSRYRIEISRTAGSSGSEIINGLDLLFSLFAGDYTGPEYFSALFYGHQVIDGAISRDASTSLATVVHGMMRSASLTALTRCSGTTDPVQWLAIINGQRGAVRDLLISLPDGSEVRDKGYVYCFDTMLAELVAQSGIPAWEKIGVYYAGTLEPAPERHGHNGEPIVMNDAVTPHDPDSEGLAGTSEPE